MAFSNFYNCYFIVDLPQPNGKLKSTKIHSVQHKKALLTGIRWAWSTCWLHSPK
jgi:hypothetical protein